MAERILIIDDDVELCALVTRYLTREGFEIETANDGERGVEKALAGDFVLIVLDVMLPKLNGFDVLWRLRAESETPVLMLTARGDDVDRIVGLEAGADDYLAKPFNPLELAARIRAILRRTKSTASSDAAEPETLRVGDVELDFGARLTQRSGETVELTGAEFDLLALLLKNAGRIVTREELVSAVLGRKLTPFDRSIDTLVSNLRRKLGHSVGSAERIKSVRGTGYVYALTRSLANTPPGAGE